VQERVDFARYHLYVSVKLGQLSIDLEALLLLWLLESFSVGQLLVLGVVLLLALRRPTAPSSCR
jgi:hypothetical protein